MEVFPFACDGADLCLLAIAEHHYGIMMEDVGDSVQVVGEVLLEGGFEVLVDVLALDEEQRQSIHEADYVCPAAVKVALHPKLPHGEEVVAGRLVEVEEPHSLFCQLAIFIAECHLHPFSHLLVLLPVGGGEGLGGDGGCDLAHGIVVSDIGQAGIEIGQPLAQDSSQHDLAVGGAAQEAAGPEVLGVMSIDRLPAELMLQVIGGGLLDEGGFGKDTHSALQCF